LPSGVIVHNNEKGWMDNNVMDLWLKRCYVQRPGGFFRQQKSLLVLDSMRVHISDISIERIQATESILAVIPVGLTKLLQPLFSLLCTITPDASFPFKHHHRWQLSTACCTC
jgi:hypothetical protein